MRSGDPIYGVDGNVVVVAHRNADGSITIDDTIVVTEREADMGDAESRAQDRRDMAQEAAEAGIPLAHYELLPDVLAARPIEPCPECGQGKHDNCDGTSWDVLADEETVCPCADADHDWEDR